MYQYEKFDMGQEHIPNNISQAPVNLLFDTARIAKRDVWDIDLMDILNLLVRILEKSGKKDLKVAGIAALSSSLIYKMKVDSIFALQRAAMDKTPMRQREDLDIDIIDIPYRHESTYPVTLDELLSLLENLIGAMANPRSKTGTSTRLEPDEIPNMKNYLVESAIATYENMILKKITPKGFGMLHDIIVKLDKIDSIRCFFAILFLAGAKKVDLEQVGDDIRITLAAPDDLSDKAEGGHED